MMNICSTCQGAQSECQQRLDADSAYRAHINEALAAEGLEYEKGKDGCDNKNFLWVLVEDYGLDQLEGEGQRPLPGLRVGPVLRLLRPAPDAPARLRRAPRARPLPRAGDRGARRRGVEYDGARKCCGFPVITMNRETSLRQAGTPHRRRDRRRAPTASSRPARSAT